MNETHNLQQIAKEYHKLKTELASVTKVYKEKKASMDGAMDALGDMAKKLLAEMGVESVRTESGTIFTSTKSYVKVEDFETFYEFVAQDNPDFLTKAARKESVMDYFEEHEEAPPGVKVSFEQSISFRK